MQSQFIHDLLEDTSAWTNFSKKLKAKKIKYQAIPYYRNYVQHFLRRAQNTPIEQLTADRVTRYLKTVPNNNALEDWQKNQAVDAIHIFLRDVLSKNYIETIDWQSFKGEVTFNPFQKIQMEELDIPELIEKRVERFKPELRERYGNLLNRMIRILRVKNYARRTEDTYLTWTNKFLGFLDGVVEEKIN